MSAVHLRLANVIIERLPWYECVTRYDRPETLFYLDPPYWQTEGYGVKFPFSEYERIAELMRSCSGKILVSLNDHPDVRAIFRDCQCIPLQLNYTIGGVDSREKRFGELIIKSWDDSVATLF